MSTVLWEPPVDVLERSRAGAFLRWLERERGLEFDDYEALRRWSVDDLEGFWGSIWEYFEIDADAAPERVLASDEMPGATWFPGVRLNYAEHVLRGEADAPAVVGLSQTRGDVRLTLGQLRDTVARCRRGLERRGVGPGDRVAAYLPNIPEALIGFLATASLGAIWSSCAPEFGTRSVIDRFHQIEPKVLLTIDGYVYGERVVDRTAESAAIQSALPSVETLVLVPYVDAERQPPAGALSWDELLAETGPMSFARVPFDHPLYILYSSGTTGLPKAIVHGHGGILLEHSKTLSLHLDIGPGDRFFWFSTTGWMMWNLLVSGLLVDAAIVLFDGNPAYPDLTTPWRIVEQERVTYFGTSAPFLVSSQQEGVSPSQAADLSSLRSLGSTGAPLPPATARWVYEHVPPAVQLGSSSGGTDICSGFVGATPLVPVRDDEISCRYLGASVEAFTPDGANIVGEVGELVITAPMPSMPVSFWGDDGTRYAQSYFDVFPGVWRHGDWITITERGGCVISGRSDATLNRGGVRLGTAEFYAALDAFPEVGDSLVVHLEGAGAGELLLFVVLRPGIEHDHDLDDRLRRYIRSELSPRHVPDRIHAVPDVPRTLSGKKLEVPVKRLLTGTPLEAVATPGALANPEALRAFVEFGADRVEAPRDDNRSAVWR